MDVLLADSEGGLLNGFPFFGDGAKFGVAQVFRHAPIADVVGAGAGVHLAVADADDDGAAFAAVVVFIPQPHRTVFGEAAGVAVCCSDDVVKGDLSHRFSPAPWGVVRFDGGILGKLKDRRKRYFR